MSTASNNSINDDTQTTSAESVVDTLRLACAIGQTAEATEWLRRWKNMETPVPRRPPKRPTVHLHSALLAAVENDHLSTVSVLLEEIFFIDYIAVRSALANRSTAMLQVFLDQGWNINKTMGPSMAPPLSRVLDDADLVRWFVTHGGDPNAAIQSWPSPLEAAAFKAPLEVIKILVDHRGRVYPSNALPAAAKTALPDRTEIVAYFLDKGAPINMIEYESDDETRKKVGVKAFGTALHQASKRGNEQLLKRGASTSPMDSIGKTAMEYALENDHRGVVTLLEQAAVVRQ